MVVFHSNVIGVIAVLRVAETPETLGRKLQSTLMEIDVEADLSDIFAHTVYVVLSWTVVGVPVIVPLRQFIESPSGSGGLISKIGWAVKPSPEPVLFVISR